MVDASLRVSIVHPFKTLRDELGMSIVYITHDLATAYYIGDNIIIMQKGQVVEGGEARTVLDNPRHPYSKLLKSAVLEPGEVGKIEGSAGVAGHDRGSSLHAGGPRLRARAGWVPPR